MGKNRSINTHFWNDTFIAELGPDEKLLYIYLLTSPLTNMLGVYEIHQRRICFDTRLDPQTVEEGLANFEEAGKAKYVEGYIILPNFIKNQNYNTNMMKSAARDIAKLPDPVLHDHFFARVWEWFRTLPKASQILADNNITIGRPPREYQGDAIPQEDEAIGQDLRGEDEPIGKWRTKGVLIPKPLRSEAFKEKIEEYWSHLMSMYKMRPSIQMVEGKFQRLLKLKKEGHDPLEVIQQTIDDGNKKFYKIRDKEFESKKNSTNGKRQEVDLNAIDQETTEIFEGRRQADQL